MKGVFLSCLCCLLLTTSAWAKVDLVTLPARDAVQLTIYNSADLTLVQENRFLTFRTGVNRLQFSWANTLIDPTSLELLPRADADRIEVTSLTYPAKTKNLGLWHVHSDFSGEAPVEISYLTSGLSWRAFYLGTLSPDERRMRLQGYVLVTNHSGEDYENARTRLVVGQVQLLDSIAGLAQRDYPYGRPRPPAPPASTMVGASEDMPMETRTAKTFLAVPRAAPKEIRKEGLSEYFLYTIEGRETIPHGWSKRLPSFDAAEVLVVNVYKYEEEMFGRSVVRFLSFKNDKDHSLGDTPIPGGMLQVFRQDNEAMTAYEGQSRFKYIPVGEDVELSLGAVQNVTVEPTLMDESTERYLFDADGNISGWDEIRTHKLEVKNTRDVPIRLEIRRNFDTPAWELKVSDEAVPYEKVDVDTVCFTLALEPRAQKEFAYTLITHHGRRAD
jgi:hypothetical protein